MHAHHNGTAPLHTSRVATSTKKRRLQGLSECIDMCHQLDHRYLRVGCETILFCQAAHWLLTQSVPPTSSLSLRIRKESAMCPSPLTEHGTGPLATGNRAGMRTHLPLSLQANHGTKHGSDPCYFRLEGGTRKLAPSTSKGPLTMAERGSSSRACGGVDNKGALLPCSSSGRGVPHFSTWRLL